MTDKKSLVEMLSRNRLFDELSKKEVGAVVDYSTEVNHPKGQMIVIEERSGVGFHLILDGTATVSTATSEPNVCIPDPNVRSHGKKIALLIVGGIAITNTAIAISHVARGRLRRVLSVSPAISTSNAATSDRYAAPNRPANFVRSPRVGCMSQ